MDPETTVLVGRNIKNARKSVGLRQNEMAEKLGISQNFLCMLETGKRSPSLYMLQKIAIMAGMSVDELLGNRNSGGDYFPVDDMDLDLDIRQLRESYQPEEIRMALKFARRHLEMDD